MAASFRAGFVVNSEAQASIAGKKYQLSVKCDGAVWGSGCRIIAFDYTTCVDLFGPHLSFRVAGVSSSCVACCSQEQRISSFTCNANSR